MKKASDPRHQRRRRAVKALFSWSFKEQEIEDQLAKKIIKHLNIKRMSSFNLILLSFVFSKVFKS